jgi:hypothetical protein
MEVGAAEALMELAWDMDAEPSKGRDVRLAKAKDNVRRLGDSVWDEIEKRRT